MQLTKFYETQEILKERIGYNEPDKLEKLFLALLVEVGECANEQRTWKYWSTDRKPRTAHIEQCECPHCDGFCSNNYDEPQNLLLEEWVDGFHFVLEIGLELGITPSAINIFFKFDNIESQFLGIFRQVHEVRIFKERSENAYKELIMMYLGLGEMLGFTDEEIENAYYLKNKINHDRQSNGY